MLFTGVGLIYYLHISSRSTSILKKYLSCYIKTETFQECKTYKLQLFSLKKRE